MKISGKVIQGKGKGRKLDFPTANVRLESEIESGVYAGLVLTGEKQYKAGIFVGDDAKLLEAHIIGFSGNLYGKEIEIEIGKKIRGVAKFETEEELKNQISKDIGLICSLE